jgi:hypothetical protein
MDADRTIKRSIAADSRRTRGTRRSKRYEDTTDHRFTPDEQKQYDSLRAQGRDMYDDLRWFEGYDHDIAFRDAAHSYGYKRTI